MNDYLQEGLVRVAVSQRSDHDDARGEWRDALDRRLVAWLGEVGALAFPVPSGLQMRGELRSWLKALSPNALVLSGGNDLGDSPERDATESALINHAAISGLPLLGICRGMQMMANHSGSNLMKASGHAGTVHCLRSAPGIQMPDQVNSYHNWCLQSCPDDYRVLAKASDGSVEAIRHMHYCWEAWMWHPERETIYDPITIARARALMHGELL